MGETAENCEEVANFLEEQDLIRFRITTKYQKAFEPENSG
jgi:hypothetical protein